MRVFATNALTSWIKRNEPQISRVAIVGGSSSEPELIELLRMYNNLDVKYFGLERNQDEEDFTFLDLNVKCNIEGNFDLVICAQVLEHVWNVSQAMANLTRLLKKDGGLLWINCPASNMRHGSPDYYSAGYSPEMLEAQTKLLGLENLMSGFIGSRRMYFFTHALNYWPTQFELAHPVITYRPLKSYGRRIITESFLGIFGRTYSVMLSSKPSTNPIYATEAYILCKSKGN